MSIESIWELYENGFFKVELDSFYNPNILLYKRQEDAIEQAFLDTRNGDRGVFILVVSKKNANGNFNVQVNHGGVLGKATIFDRLNTVLRQEERLIDAMIDWDKAILIFDWEKDIDKSMRDTEKFGEEGKRELIDVALKSEVYKLQKFLQDELHQAAEELNLEVNDRGMKKPEISDSDLPRYNYYLQVVIELLRMIAKGYI